jgi:hypothetical protein
VGIGHVTAVRANAGKAEPLSAARRDLDLDGRPHIEDVTTVTVNQGHRVP